MDFILWLIAVVLVIWGIVTIVRGQDSSGASSSSWSDFWSDPAA